MEALLLIAWMATGAAAWWRVVKVGRGYSRTIDAVMLVYACILGPLAWLLFL